MAEILGLVSGSITVAETASAVLKLKRLWNEVRDAPAYIDSLIDQLSLVHPLLTETETELGADEKLLASSSAARLSLNYCKKILWDLDGVAHDLRQQIEDKRRLSRGKTRVKVVLGKETLYALQKRMQDSLQLLGIAQQTYLIALAKSQPRLVADQIRSLDTTTPLEQENETKTEKGLVRRPAKLRAANNAFTSYTLPWRYSGLFGSYTSHTCGTSDKAYHARIQMPTWLANRVWDFCAQRASHGWTYSLRQWSVRSERADIFRAASEGDLPKIIQLFENGQASLYDRRPEGVTLLHFAVLSGSQPTITYLINQGLSIHEPAYHRLTTLDMLALHAVYRPEEGFRDVLWSLKSMGELTDSVTALFDPDAEPRDTGDLGYYLFGSSSLTDLVLDEIRQAPPEHRFRSINWWSADPKLLYNMLQADGHINPNMIRQQLWKQPGGSLNTLAKMYFFNVPCCPDTMGGSLGKRADFQDWRILVCWLLRGMESEELSIPKSSGWRRRLITPLFAGLEGGVDFWKLSPRSIKLAKNRLQQCLVFWLEDLKAVGIDLQKYGQQETRLLREDSGWDFAEWNNSRERRGRPRLASFRYGPEPEDWRLVWEEVFLEDFVGDFFSFAELPPSMPGAWVD